LLLEAAGQLPLPSQLTADVKLPTVQLACRQPVLLDQGAQFPAPSHVPLFEQSPPPALLLVVLQRFFGSSVPAATDEQVPTLPATLQLRHRPLVPVVASLQALLQQTPSVQKVLEH
jgi:hypothetical protein